MKYSYSPDARWDAKPQYRHTNIIFKTELHEFFHELREFDKTSNIFLSVIIFWILKTFSYYRKSSNKPPGDGVGGYLFQTHLSGGGLI